MFDHLSFFAKFHISRSRMRRAKNDPLTIVSALVVTVLASSCALLLRKAPCFSPAML